MPSIASHPDTERLRRFGLGQLPDEDARVVESHVAVCDRCTAALQEVQADTLVSFLRADETTPKTPAPDDPELAGNAGATGPLPEEPTEETEPLKSVSADSIPGPLLDHPRYRILRLLGRGGMGDVYLALHLHLAREVALKVIKPALLEDPATVQRFRQEMRSVARLSHPNIVQAFDADQAGDLVFLIMEYVKGRSLHDHLKANGPLPAREACAYARQAALGLQHAFEHGMTHRDIKPHNLMLTPDGRIKVLDFGLARVVAGPEGGAILTGPGMVLGTADYIAPEQSRDSSKADIRADIYSLGCTLYHMLTGRTPYTGRTTLEKIMKHRSGELPPLISLRADLPPGLPAVVLRCLAKDPADRYQTPAEAADALAEYSNPEETGATTAITQDQAGEKHPEVASRRRTRLLVAGLAILVGAAILASVIRSRLPGDSGERLPKGEKPARGEENDKPALAPDKVGLIRTVPVLTNMRDACVEFSPDGRLYFATLDGRGAWGAYQMVLETATGRTIRTLGQGTEAFCNLVFLPDGKHLIAPQIAYGTSRYFFRLWDFTSGQQKPLDHLVDPGGWPCCGNVSADGKRFSFLGAKSAFVVDLETGRELLRLDRSTPEKRMAARSHFMPDGNTVVSCLWEGPNESAPFNRQMLRIDDLQSGKTETIELPATFLSRISDTIFPAGKDRVGMWNLSDNKIRPEYRMIPGGKVIHRGKPIGKGKRQGGPYMSLDGSRCAVWCEDRRLRFYDLPSGREVYQTEPLSGIFSVSFSTDGRFFAYRGGRLGAKGPAVYELHRLPDPPTDSSNP